MLVITSFVMPSAPRVIRRCATYTLVCISAHLLSACAHFQENKLTATPINEAKLDLPSNLEQGDEWPQSDWWKIYKDPQLDELIDHALTSNPSLAVARARIARAQAATELSRSSKSIQVSSNLEAGYGRLSENYLTPKAPIGPGGTYVDQGKVTLNFSYDIDLWNRNAALIQADEALLRAAVFDQQAARLALTTTIAKAYAELGHQYALQEVLLAAQKQRQSLSDLTQKRVGSGLDTQVELQQAKARQAALKIDVNQLNTAIKITRLQLVTLAGYTPDQAQKITAPKFSPISFKLPRSLPADILVRRPELAAQKARIYAAIGRTQAAKAEFYPNINLIALIGAQAIGLGQLFTPGSVISSIGPAIHLPIFDGGRLRANYSARTAEADLVIEQYNESVMSAIQEVAETLTRISALDEETKASREALKAAEDAYRFALLRYEAGISTYLSVLTAETQLLQQKQVNADVKAKELDLQISLYRALGGGFYAPSTQTSMLNKENNKAR